MSKKKKKLGLFKSKSKPAKKSKSSSKKGGGLFGSKKKAAKKPKPAKKKKGGLFKSIGKGLSKAGKNVGKGIKKGVKGVGKGIGKAGKAIGKAAKKVGGAVVSAATWVPLKIYEKSMRKQLKKKGVNVPAKTTVKGVASLYYVHIVKRNKSLELQHCLRHMESLEHAESADNAAFSLASSVAENSGVPGAKIGVSIVQAIVNFFKGSKKKKDGEETTPEEKEALGPDDGEHSDVIDDAADDAKEVADAGEEPTSDDIEAAGEPAGEDEPGANEEEEALSGGESDRKSFGLMNIYGHRR